MGKHQNIELDEHTLFLPVHHFMASAILYNWLIPSVSFIYLHALLRILLLILLLVRLTNQYRGLCLKLILGSFY